MRPLLRLLLCITLFSLCLYSYLHHHNKLIELRVKLPELADELVSAEERNEALRYELDQLESPLRLMQHLKEPEFSGLRYPTQEEVLVVHRTKSE